MQYVAIVFVPALPGSNKEEQDARRREIRSGAAAREDAFLCDWNADVAMATTRGSTRMTSVPEECNIQHQKWLRAEMSRTTADSIILDKWPFCA